MNPYILFLLGIFVGTILTCILAALRRTFGTLEIDRSNPEKDTYRININDLDIVAKKKEVVLKVRTNSELSQDEQRLL